MTRHQEELFRPLTFEEKQDLESIRPAKSAQSRLSASNAC
jgi:hypothetical protein